MRRGVCAVCRRSCSAWTNFINTFPDDGGCEEGPGYWNVGVGNCFEALELLHSASAGRIDIYADPLLLNMGLYVPRTQILGDFYINQGDASSIVKLDPDKLYRYAKRVHSTDLLDTALAGRLQTHTPAAGAEELARFHVVGAVLPSLFNEQNLRREPARKAPLYRDTWLPDSHVMAARKRAGSAEGLYLACIADNNGKSHSHNDTGNFWVFSNGLPILIDLGQQTYTKQSFDKHRYEIPSTQSGLHNLPTIGSVKPGIAGVQSGPAADQRTAGAGYDQGAGPQFRATDLRYAANDDAAQLEMNLAQAYPAAAGVVEWRRSVKLVRVQDHVTVADMYRLSRPQAVTFNLMTTCTVRLVRDGVLELTNPVWGQTDNPTHTATCPPARIRFDATRLTYAIETIPLENEELVRNWGKQVFRIRLTAKPAESGSFQLNIQNA